MHIQVKADTLALQGELTIMSIQRDDENQLLAALSDQINTLDLSEVTRADSACVSLLLCALRKRPITIKNLPRSVQLLIELYDLSTVMEPKKNAQ
ncbi:STAS domain-containing protein [Neisseria sp. Ec49-e6-T10]|uniref:STAS domain-containing protein n=1 Tax=Neisseria sp. Ec49-e6-T10 TaxID=3140744 RepID=UPI003EBA8619